MWNPTHKTSTHRLRSVRCVSPSYFRNTPVIYTLPQMLGHLQITTHLSLGQFISNMKVGCYLSCLIYWSFQRCVSHDSNPLTMSTNYFQSHTGVAMALAFQRVLKQFGLTEKIHAVNADNTTANDKQTTKLDTLDNSFEVVNCVWC